MKQIQLTLLTHQCNIFNRRPHEISVQKGDIVILRRQIDYNWVEIEDCQSGLIGLVPRRYLDSEQEGLGRVLFTFIAKHPGEISLTKVPFSHAEIYSKSLTLDHSTG